MPYIKKKENLCVSINTKGNLSGQNLLKIPKSMFLLSELHSPNTAVETSESNILVEFLPCMPGTVLGRHWAYKGYFRSFPDP